MCTGLVYSYGVIAYHLTKEMPPAALVRGFSPCPQLGSARDVLRRASLKSDTQGRVAI